METLEERVDRRAPVLLSIAEALQSSGAIPSDVVLLRPLRVPFTAAAYFLLNAAYKEWRIEDGHWTEVAKIAALQCLAIMTLPPFRPLNPTNARTTVEARCNEMFAVAAASAVLGADVAANNSENFNFRLLDVISECRSQTLEPFVVDLSMEIDRPLGDYRLRIHGDDKLKINSLITIFELVAGSRR